MNISDLNKFLQRLTSYDLTPFDQDGLTYTRLKDGNMLNIYATDLSLMLFMQVDVLGNAGDEHPEIFRELLHSNIIGGKFGNLRIVYDNESTAIWICHDILWETINADSFVFEIDMFVKNAPLLIKLLREDIIATYLGESGSVEENRNNTEKLIDIYIANLLRV
ncbi:type III secretion system chaperone [Succinivibrio dextrinosolvens]|uniref:Tir chaperone protein (CesT) family protein n=1 Tax=Succinivibrio dextrinosolvens TaxID=83771 RepID=A0A662Z9N2_9GAMM|nr:type III secretion system chaperone [Succinivibrio dextrinosolvens]SFK13986.1 hypothetical protein SAMN04487865_102921 [Succinivibrio dextrinosolvens]